MHSWLLACVLCVLCSVDAHSGTPSEITVQGRLTDSTGTPFPPGNRGFLFRIFDSQNGGSEIWSGEDHFLTIGADGLWTAQVGRYVGLTDAVFADTVRWLDIAVDGIVLPRIRLVTSPFAHRISTVDGASGGNITSKVSIGPGHTNTGTNAFVAGEGSVASGNYSTVSGGKNDTASNWYSTVGGGLRNRASGQYVTIGGGAENRSFSDYATIGGGTRNSAGFAGTVAGGQLNDASATNGASIVGGVENTADGSFSSIGGGYKNQAFGDYSTIGGGGGSSDIDSNVTRGFCATIPGGRRNRASGSFSFAAGRRAHALHHGTFVWADSTDADFASTGQDQFLIRASGGVGIGTNDPDRLLHVQDGSAGIVTGNSNASAVFERNGDSWIHILSPDANMRGILFGSPANALMGSIRFNPSGGGEEKGYEIRGRNNNILVEIDSLGNLNARGNLTATGTCCASDERLKRNIQTLPHALNTVTCLRGVSYEWKPDESGERIFPPGQQIGVVAQEVRSVVPQAVVEQSDGYLAVDYTRLVPLLIEGMKEQQRTIELQNERIANLEKKLEQ